MLETQTEKILKFNNLKPFHRDIFQVQKVNFERLLIFANSQKNFRENRPRKSHDNKRQDFAYSSSSIFSGITSRGS